MWTGCRSRALLGALVGWLPAQQQPVAATVDLVPSLHADLVGSDSAAMRRALWRVAADPKLAARLAGDVAALLAVADVDARRGALAVVVVQPQAFAGARAELVAALRAAHDDECAALAFDAAAPWFVVPGEAVEKLVERIAAGESQRGIDRLCRLGSEALPALPRVLSTPMLMPQELRKLLDALIAADAAATESALLAFVGKMDTSDPLTRLLQALQVAPMQSALLERIWLAALPYGFVDWSTAQALGQAARTDAALRARLGDLCGRESLLARGGLTALQAAGPAAADQWDKVVPCLRCGNLVSMAADIAVAVTGKCDVTDPLLVAIADATGYRLTVIAGALPRCGVRLGKQAPALGRHLADPDPNAAIAVAKLLWAEPASEVLRANLPALIAHADAGARCAGCLFATALGDASPEVAAALAGLDRDPAPEVVSTRVFTALLDNARTSVNMLEDAVRERDRLRQFVAVVALRRRTAHPEAAELAGLAALLVPTDAFSTWVIDTVERDLDTGRMAPADVGRLASIGNETWGLQRLLARLIVRPDAEALWSAMLGASRGTPRLAVLSQLQSALTAGGADRFAALRSQIEQLAADPGATIERPLAQRLRDALGSDKRLVEPAELVLQIGDDASDAARRSLLCERLQGLQRATWEAAVTELRCSGSAAARRCAAALLGESVAGDWRLAQWLAAPEPFVVAVALAEALRSDAQRRGGQQQADVGLRERVRAIPARPEVMLSCLRRFGPGQFRAIAALGPDGLNLIAAGLEMPELRAYMFANLSSLGAAARPLLPLVLRELHRDPDGHAARALYAMGISADDPDRAHIVTEVVAAWHESPSGQSALLPAMAAVADEPVIRATLLASRAQLQHWMTLAASTKAQWRSLIDLVADEDDSTKLRVALAVMAPTLPQPLPFNYEEWTRVAAAPVLQAIVSRRLEDSSGDAVSLAQSLLEATALGIELARLGAVLERLGPAVEKALPVVVERQGWTRSLAVALARHRPALFLQVLPESVPPGIASVFAELPLRPELIAPLADRCASKNDDVRTAAAIALVRQGPAAGQRVLSLLFGKPEAAEPMRAALFALASRAEFLLPELQQFLRDNPGRAEQVFRCAASLGPHGLVWALDAVGSDDESTRQLLREGLRASDRGTRVLALQILEDRDTPDLQGLVRTACGDPDAEVRRRACLMMLRMSNPDLAAVEPLLLDHDPLLRRRGFEALAKTREWPTRVLALATDALGDPDARVRIAVVAAFAANTALAAKVGKALAEALEVTSEPELASALRRLISK